MEAAPFEAPAVPFLPPLPQRLPSAQSEAVGGWTPLPLLPPTPSPPRLSPLQPSAALHVSPSPLSPFQPQLPPPLLLVPASPSAAPLPIHAPFSPVSHPPHIRRAHSVPIVHQPIAPPSPSPRPLNAGGARATLSTIEPPVPLRRSSSKLSELKGAVLSLFSRRSVTARGGSPAVADDGEEDVHVNFSLAVSHGYQCTDAMAGGEGLLQPLFACLDCHDSGRALCESCVSRCHPLHRVRAVPRSASLSRCSCGPRCPAKLPAAGSLVHTLPVLCTTRRSGRGVPIRQPLFFCQDCLTGGGDASLLCSSCVRVCHAGHRTQQWPNAAAAACQCSDRLCVAKDLDISPARIDSLSPQQRLALYPSAREAKEGNEEKAERTPSLSGSDRHSSRRSGGGVEESTSVEGEVYQERPLVSPHLPLTPPVLYLPIAPGEEGDQGTLSREGMDDSEGHAATHLAGQVEGGREGEPGPDAETGSTETTEAETEERLLVKPGESPVVLMSPPMEEEEEELGEPGSLR